ncbi:MAG: hypothetical protein AMJ79_05005 [Phycisphaerae bacterium SM23_30]|nr:MAG: hypothetical protein AMJ79_05005 [Phycisphaerae bacterium SM23_30]
MTNRRLWSIVVINLLLGVTITSASVIQKDLPYNSETIYAPDTSVDGYYDNFNWLNDGNDNIISGSVDSLRAISKENAWLKIGFGEYSGPGGCLVFYADDTGQRKAYLQYTDGNVDSNVVVLASSSGSGPLYSFTITAYEASGTFDATVTDKDDTHYIYGNGTNDLSCAMNYLFAVGISNGDKAVVDGDVSLIPEPCSLLLIGLGAGVLRLRRRR